MKVRMPLLMLLCINVVPVHAQPLAEAVVGHWRVDSAGIPAGGTLAPMPLLGEVRPGSPTSLPLKPGGEIAFEVGRTVPVTYAQGNRYFVELEVDTRQVRIATPLAAKTVDACWWLGLSMTAADAHLYHRDRWLDDRASGDGSGTTLALAWRGGRWTLGAARHDADLSGNATGSNLADILNVRRGHERAEFGWDGRVDTLGAQYDADDWMAGAQFSERDDTARLSLDVAADPFNGRFTTNTRTLDAWVAQGPPSKRYFAYFTHSDTDPGVSAIASGGAIRGRTSLSADSTVIGIGRRRTGDRATEHLELSWMEHSLDFSGRLSDGVLGSIDGQISAEASAGTRTLAARWGRTQQRGRWQYTLAASAMHTDVDCYARAIGSPGTFLAPDWNWEERLIGGGGVVGSVAFGVGRTVDGWQIDALYTRLGGDTWGHFKDMTENASLNTQARIPPAPDTGPSPTLDLGWTFSLQVSREL